MYRKGICDMHMRDLGNTGLKASAVSMGTLSIGGDEVWGNSDEAESIRTLDKAAELGITFFDTAAFYGYGRSETILGKALKGKREKYIVSTKCGLDWDSGEGSFFFERDGHVITKNLSPKGVRRSVENSLRRLGMDYVDFCFTHWQAEEPCMVPIADTMGELCRLKEEGKIRHIGASNVTLEQVCEYRKYGELDAIQEHMSMVYLDSFDEVNDFCVQNGIMYHAYSVFERGLLTGAYTMESVVRPGDARNEWCEWYRPDKRQKVLTMLDEWKPLLEKYQCSQAALTVAWTLQQAPNIIVDAGARRVSTIIENARGGEITIEPEDLQKMNTAVRALQR